MKTCFNCNIQKPFSDYYRHSKMSDGYLNKCKTCVKEYAKARTERLKNDPDWAEKEAERSRLKYYKSGGYKKKSRLSRKKSIDNYDNRYPEKKRAKNQSQYLRKKGFECHHWSYNEVHYQDVIYLNPKFHAFVHRFLVYDQGYMMYRNMEGVLLCRKDLHQEYINSLKESFDDYLLSISSASKNFF